MFAAVCGVAFASPASAAIELLINPGQGGALSLRATGSSAEPINGYSIYSAGGFLADLGDETLGGALSAILLDVDNVGDDEVAMWTLGGSGPLPPLSVSHTGNGIALNLAWIGGSADPLADLVFVYGPDGLTTPGGDPIFSLPGEVVLLSVPGLAGDFNGNGTVEQADLDLVLGNWGAATTPPTFVANTAGLSNGVDQDELDAVLGNWGDETGPSFAGFAVPEPGLLTVGALFFVTGVAVRGPRKKSSRIF